MNETKYNVLLTGSSGNFGSFLCRAFLTEGHRVTGIDLHPGPNHGEISQFKEHWRFFQGDLANRIKVKSVLEHAHDGINAFDVVINSVGLIHNEPLLSFKEGRLLTHCFEAWNKTVSVNLSAAFFVTALCAQKMVSTRTRGVIINISSICSRGNIGQSAYSAAKAGINAMTQSLARELGPLGIRIASISPGFFDTASTRASLDDQKIKHIRQNVPLKKLGQPEHLIKAVKFVIDNDYFNGKVLDLDGGFTF